jgi:hypothetical protein
VQIESVRWMVDLAVRAGVERIVFEQQLRHGYNGTERRGLRASYGIEISKRSQRCGRV